MVSPKKVISETKAYFTEEEAEHAGLVRKGWRKVESTRRIWNE